jgi:hypothetical protein
MKKKQKTKSKAPTAPKRPPGRPRKNGTGRIQSGAWLPADLTEQLDGYVRSLRPAEPGSSRGDVLARALRAYRPFRLWLQASMIP